MDYTFYSRQYRGNLTEDEFDSMLPKARAVMDRYKRIYTVTGEESRENMAVCSFVDILYRRQRESEGSGPVASVSVGSVTTSYATASRAEREKLTSKKLYNALCLYMYVYRGIR